MRRKKAKRNVANPPKQPSVVPVDDYAEADKSHPDTIFVQVGDVMVPSQSFKKKKLEAPLRWTDTKGRDLTIDSVFEMGERLPFGGVPVPGDVDKAIEAEGYRRFERWRDNHLREGALVKLCLEDESSNVAVCDVLFALQRAVEAGFYLALLRYADDLKNVPEAVANLERLKRGRKKGTATTKRKAEPRRMAIRRRFREKRKSGFSKGAAREEIQQEYRSKGEKISIRHLERCTRGLS